ncbi:MAG TPA: Lrp/AsnC ligand binding domain-containing protein [Prolixibacteraceae bacterium]|nr:Lrp/AsnC ligand binding domain-containing protein [Prolixibacteraceae bacterium]
MSEELSNQQMNIDELDKKILKLITKNARIPFLEVARECGVSGAAIHQRVQRLLNMGIVSGSEFILCPEKLGYNTCAYMGIHLEKASFHKEVVLQLKAIPEIVECHCTTGQYAIFVKIMTKTNKHLRQIIDNEFQKINGIARTETFMSLELEFSRQAPVK